MSVGPTPDLPTIDPAHLAAEVDSLAQDVHHFLNNPGVGTDPRDLAQRIARLEALVRDLTTDELSRWLENLRGLLEPAR